MRTPGRVDAAHDSTGSCARRAKRRMSKSIALVVPPWSLLRIKPDLRNVRSTPTRGYGAWPRMRRSSQASRLWNLHEDLAARALRFEEPKRIVCPGEWKTGVDDGSQGSIRQPSPELNEV
jgi:hypothetical protein